MLSIMIVHLTSRAQHQILVQMVVFQWHRKLSSTWAVIVLWGCALARKYGNSRHLILVDTCLHCPWSGSGTEAVPWPCRFSDGCRGHLPLTRVPRTFSLISGLLPISRSPENCLWVGSLPRALRTGVASGNYLLDPNCTICGNPLCNLRHVCLSCNL